MCGIREILNTNRVNFYIDFVIYAIIYCVYSWNNCPFLSLLVARISYAHASKLTMGGTTSFSLSALLQPLLSY